MGNGFDALSKHPAATNVNAGTKPVGVTYDPALVPAEEVSRIVLRKGIICSLPTPKQTKTIQMPDGAKCEQFGIPVNGGYINFYIFERTKCSVHGKRMWVECLIGKRTMSDGREFLYVDLHPTDLRPTHDRKVWQHRREMPEMLPEGTEKFECYGNIFGVLGFVPLEEKGKI